MSSSSVAILLHGKSPSYMCLWNSIPNDQFFTNIVPILRKILEKRKLMNTISLKKQNPSCLSAVWDMF